LKKRLQKIETKAAEKAAAKKRGRFCGIKERADQITKDAQARFKREKFEKEALENPTADANGENIQTAAQQILVQGEATVEQKTQVQQKQLANEPATPSIAVKESGSCPSDVVDAPGGIYKWLE